MQSHRPAWFPVQFGKHSPWHRFDAVRRTALFWGQLLCPGGSCCRGRGAALMGMNPAGESTQTGTKPRFIAASTFDIHKGHSCPLLCIFMHLWPRSIWLGWGIKLGCCRDGSSHKNQHPLSPQRCSKQWVWWGGGGWRVTIRDTWCLREAPYPLYLLLIMLWGCCQEHFWSPADSVCDILLTQTLQSIWHFVTPGKWALHGSAAPLQLPTRARLKPSDDDDAWWAEMTEGNNVGSGYPQITGYTWSLLSQLPGLGVAHSQAPSDRPCLKEKLP